MEYNFSYSQWSMWVLVFVLERCICVELTYYAKEGKNLVTLVGNISCWFPSNGYYLVTGSQIDYIQSATSENSKKFSTFSCIKKNMGKLYTAKMLDTESICS